MSVSAPIRFTSRGAHIDIPGLAGDITHASPPTAVASDAPVPRNHGLVRMVPTMECYHGLLSFDHDLDGSLRLGDEELDFAGGRGYIEKDWGQSVPVRIRLDADEQLPHRGTSLSASVAIIPYGGAGLFEASSSGFGTRVSSTSSPHTRCQTRVFRN